MPFFPDLHRKSIKFFSTAVDSAQLISAGIFATFTVLERLYNILNSILVKSKVDKDETSFKTSSTAMICICIGVLIHNAQEACANIWLGIYWRA